MQSGNGKVAISPRPTLPPICQMVRTMVKLTQCIVCNSKWKDAVDDQLKHGLTYASVCAFLKDKGLILSEQSISRHNKNHRLSNKKPKQVQKGNIKRAKAKANPPEPAPDRTPAGKKRGKFHDGNIKRDILLEETELAKRKSTIKEQELSYAKELEALSQDIDVIKEYIELLAISKNRIKRALDEEDDTGLVLATTSTALKDYQSALKNFHEITSGMESITKLRFSQLVQMVGNIFVQAPLTDQARLELLTLLEHQTLHPEPIRVVQSDDANGNEDAREDELLATISDEDIDDIEV